MVETLPTITQVEPMDKREIANAALDKNSETFVIYISALKPIEKSIHCSPTAHITTLRKDKALTNFSAKHVDYVNFFLSDLAIEHSENTAINKHAIKLVEGKQQPYGSIYALNLPELKTLNTYIKSHLKTRFIKTFKSPTDASIPVNKKL